MDISFDAYGSGWNDDQGGVHNPNNRANLNEEYGSSTQATQRNSALEKIPIPVCVSELLKMPENEERYNIGSYHFNTIRLIGRVVEVNSDDKTCITYQICDSKGPKDAQTFTVIRYQGVETSTKIENFNEGSLVQAVGKLRSFNNRLSLISFHIREVNKDEAELFELESQVAYIYYIKQIAEKTMAQLDQLNVSLFSAKEPVRGVNGGALSQRPLQSQQNATDNGDAKRLYQQPTQEARNRGLAGQQANIYQYIKENGAGAGGISAFKIQTDLRTNQNFKKDIEYLLAEGIIYTTLDDDHFAVIE